MTTDATGLSGMNEIELLLEAKRLAQECIAERNALAERYHLAEDMLDRTVKQRDNLAERLKDVYVKDRLKTRELNLLVTENRGLRAALEEALKTNGVCVAYKGFPHTCTNTALCEAQAALTEPHV